MSVSTEIKFILQFSLVKDIKRLKSLKRYINLINTLFINVCWFLYHPRRPVTAMEFRIWIWVGIWIDWWNWARVVIGQTGKHPTNNTRVILGNIIFLVWISCNVKQPDILLPFEIRAIDWTMDFKIFCIEFYYTLFLPLSFTCYW